MSDIYVLEPSTNGKVIIHTTHGDLDIELWSKECPKACQNFLQLCIDGYYDNTIFHRIIKGFIIQGGDPTGTGHGGESIFDTIPFPVEVHPRLQFRYRGLVGLASTSNNTTESLDPDYVEKRRHGSQFFITLGRADALNKQNTLFGKVTGNTLYNLVAISELATDSKTDRPFDPPVIKSIEILFNPFQEIKPRPGSKYYTDQDTSCESQNQSTKKTQSHQHRNILSLKKSNLLSFESDENDDDEYHTEIDNQSNVISEAPSTLNEQDRGKNESVSKNLALLKSRIATKCEANKLQSFNDHQSNGLNDEDQEEEEGEDPEEDEGEDSDSYTTDDEAEDSSDDNEETHDIVEKTNINPLHENHMSGNGTLSPLVSDQQPKSFANQTLHFKSGLGTADQFIRERDRMPDANLYSDYEKNRQLYITKRDTQSKRSRQNNIMEKFQEFQTQLREIRKQKIELNSTSKSHTNNTQIDDNSDDIDDNNWIQGKGLKFAIDSNRAHEIASIRDSVSHKT